MRKQLERNELIQRNSGLRENTAAEENCIPKAKHQIPPYEDMMLLA